MNVSDTEIVRALLLSSTSPQFTEVETEDSADLLLTNTCAIREGAETKIWQRLRLLRSMDNHSSSNYSPRPAEEIPTKRGKRIVGVLGCMAERLKDSMFTEGNVDLIVGPDAYRDLPNLVGKLLDTTSDDSSGRASNTQLSLEETYGEIHPIREGKGASAFVSVMRGCNNMCSYCIVPFTRGRERSRELGTIVTEVTRLVEEQGVKEVVLLGQNVNSYHDKNESAIQSRPDSDYKTSSPGFSNTFKSRGGGGYYFADLVDAVSRVDPELRVRFTSPHPKDFPRELLQLIAERSNVCNHLHMPSQSGSTTVLERMRRGYSRESYLELIQDVRERIPGVGISTDMIAGFCGETEEEHEDSVTLMEEVGYDQAFMFAYSMREKTHAHRRMQDDVEEPVKQRRLREIIDTFYDRLLIKNQAEIGSTQTILVEGESKKGGQWSGRSDANKTVVFEIREEDKVEIGDYVRVGVKGITGPTLIGSFKGKTTLREESMRG